MIHRPLDLDHFFFFFFFRFPQVGRAAFARRRLRAAQKRRKRRKTQGLQMNRKGRIRFDLQK